MEKLICSGCGAPLRRVPGLGRAVCDYCGSVYAVSQPASVPKTGGARGDNPVDIRITPVPAAPISLFITEPNSYTKNDPSGTNGLRELDAPDGGDVLCGRLEPQVRQFAALSLQCLDTYDLVAALNVRAYHEECFLHDILYAKEKTFFKSVNAVHREHSQRYEKSIASAAERLGFRTEVTAQDKFDCDRRITIAMNPAAARKYLPAEMTALMDRMKDNRLVRDVSRRMAEALEIRYRYVISEGNTHAPVSLAVYPNYVDLCSLHADISPVTTLRMGTVRGGRYYINEGDFLSWRYTQYGMGSLPETWQQQALAAVLTARLFEQLGELGLADKYRVASTPVLLSGFSTVTLALTEKTEKIYEQW